MILDLLLWISLCMTSFLDADYEPASCFIMKQSFSPSPLGCYWILPHTPIMIQTVYPFTIVIENCTLKKGMNAKNPHYET